MMLEKLKSIKEKYSKLEKELENQEILQDPARFAQVNKEFHHLKKIHDLIVEYEQNQNQVKDVKSMLKSESDSELISLAKKEIDTYEKNIQHLEQAIKIQLIPKDPNDEKNIILEMRAGAGGDEASLFVQDLFEAYQAYTQKKKWKMDIISFSSGNTGGYKEIITSISGDRVYSFLKYESGVHRVQRVPKTESQGRVHTSTITVVVLPEASPVEVKINPNDLRIDVCRSSGAGGQHVNTTDSAVRITHLPTKIMVYCQQEKSQHANKEKAFKILYAKLLDFQTEQIRAKESKQRQQQIGTGDRSQKIRTYNFPQSRITDHRIQMTTKNLSSVLAGNFEEFFQALNMHYQTEALKESDEDS